MYQPKAITLDEVYKAIKKGDLDTVKSYVGAGQDIDAVFSDDDTLLTASIYRKQYDIADYLITNGANLDKSGQNYHGAHKPLSIWLKDSDVNDVDSKAFAIFKKCVENGASFQNISENNRNILHLAACRHGYENVFEFLLSRVNSLEELSNYRNRDDETLEASVYETGNPVIIRLFVVRQTQLEAAQGTGARHRNSATPATSATPTIGTQYHLQDKAVLEVTRYLSSGEALSEIYNFAARRLTTLSPVGPVNENFAVVDTAALECAVEKLTELGGDPGENWHYSSFTSPKSRVTWPVKTADKPS